MNKLILGALLLLLALVCSTQASYHGDHLEHQMSSISRKFRQSHESQEVPDWAYFFRAVSSASGPYSKISDDPYKKFMMLPGNINKDESKEHNLNQIQSAVNDLENHNFTVTKNSHYSSNFEKHVFTAQEKHGGKKHGQVHYSVLKKPGQDQHLHHISSYFGDKESMQKAHDQFYASKSHAWTKALNGVVIKRWYLKKELPYDHDIFTVRVGPQSALERNEEEAKEALEEYFKTHHDQTGLRLPAQEYADAKQDVYGHALDGHDLGDWKEEV